MYISLISSSTLPDEDEGTFPESEREYSFWTFFRVLVVILHSATALMTVLGNGFVLGAIVYMRSSNWKQKTRKHAGAGGSPLASVLLNAFVVNLAIADLLVGLVVQPLMITTLVDNRWRYGESFCVMYQVFIFWLCSASELFLCAIAIDRYIGVTRPLHYSLIMTRCRRIALICGVWAFSLILTLCSLLISPPQQETPDLYCVITTKLENVIWTAAGTFFLPGTFMLIAYGRIYQVVRAKRKQETENALSEQLQLRMHRGGSGHTNMNAVEAAKFRKQSEGTKTLALIVGAYLLSWGPVFTLLLLEGSGVHFEALEILLELSMVLGLGGSSVNPIIYIAASKSLRLILAECLNKLKRWLAGAGDCGL